MSDLQQEIQQANQSDSEKETSSEGTESQRVQILTRKYWVTMLSERF